MVETQLTHYARPVPRYTSYPTAPHFSDAVGPSAYQSWLSALPEDAGLSLYVHIPYCDRLCWFCGCNTKQTHKYAPIATYLGALYREIDMVARLTEGRGLVQALHFGGGSPTMLKPEDMVALDAHLRAAFYFAPEAEIAVEIDPNDMDEGRYDALMQIGLTRASLGVQDFDPDVQKAINRLQTADQTRAVVEAVRARGVRSVNMDVLYGLPHQSEQSMARTIDQVLDMAPDRIALFGYAHVPWMKKHQTMIDEKALPDVAARRAQQTKSAARLIDAGYQPVGIDHFALPDDAMALAARRGTLRRNFQGYTVDGADALIGLGASSIGQLPQGYVQNVSGSGAYRARIDEGELPVARGIALSLEDRARAHIIEQLMCNFGFDGDRVVALFGAQGRALLAEANILAATEPNGYFVKSGNRYDIVPEGQAFARTLAAHFDAYLGNGAGRHSVAV